MQKPCFAKSTIDFAGRNLGTMDDRYAVDYLARNGPA